jgi:crossover junction endodeoxyribonuclease RuvC
MTAVSARGFKRRSFAARRIVGIDPGTVVTGWGVIEAAGNRLTHLAHGIITTNGALGQGERLARIYRGIREVIEAYQPHGISLEKVFFARNAQSALKLGQARGVALLAGAENHLEIFEYSTNEIKSAVVGYGHATKAQVQTMVASLLGVSQNMVADAADALAAAICHHHRQSFHARVLEALPGWAPVARRRS